MKKQIVYMMLLNVCITILGVYNIYEYVTTGDGSDIVFAVILLFTAGRSAFKILKKDSKYMHEIENNPNNSWTVIICVILVAIRFAIPAVRANTSAKIDYAAQLNLGRYTPYYRNIPTDDFNELYQQLLDNEWGAFFLPSKLIPGNTTIHNISTVDDTITVEYGNKKDVTMRFVQTRNDADTGESKLDKPGDGQYITGTLTEEITVENMVVTQTITNIEVFDNSQKSVTVYTYNWSKGQLNFLLEVADSSQNNQEKMIDEIYTIISKIDSVDVNDSRKW